MQSIPRKDVPVVIDDNGVEVRLRDADGLSVGFVRLPAGADLRPATKGLPHDLCPCPHWGYMIKGRVRMHTLDGHQDFAAGEAFYWAPGHAPEALEDSEYVDFSPTEEFSAGDRAHHVGNRRIRVIGRERTRIVADREDIVEQTSQLIIIGGGITGLNALAVASRYVSPRDRVVLLDSRPRAGGMWVDTYDFVRLHQPYPIFTAGSIPWELGEPASHLATRDEVLDHLRHCVDVARTKVDLEERFGWEYIEHSEAGGTVAVTVRGPDGRIETLTTKRLIKAYGNHVLPSSPLSISSAAVRSTTPEALSGLIAERPEDSSPVWIIGSGKTAMDVALMLRRECPGRELNMVAGSGTMFSRRETFFPTGPRRWYAGTRVNAMLRQAALRFDGTNEQDLVTWFADAYGISPSAELANFFGAYLSDAECANVRAGVRRIEPGHFDDVLDTADGPTIVLRDGRSLPIPADSWIVNCTGYLAQPRRPYEPFVSDTGNVLSIQLRSSVTGPFTSFAGYFLTHLMFRGKLRAARLYELDLEDLATKSRSVIIWASITLTMYNVGRIARSLPPKVTFDCGLDFDRWYPRARQMAGATALLATQPWDAPHYRKTLDTLGKRFDVQVGPAHR